ncbi:GUN4 domain-containing protein [Nodularia spumigena]|jgi:eukaryotic-like serine/threonine-protein kinase|uniref:Ycf53-like protein n=1 Tax=Nodularia spumigena UHCC 0039 TaxID=1914872 RepID=A0A2S0QB38_NODSP|nr:GUN4 domain-containing protein [Nodularia spumigena]AVZ31510.1 Ycf53-like protein [Nodularia spumigena UHCC 0039]
MDELNSAVGMDYTQLRDLLAVGKWKEADKETARVMLAVTKREKEGWLDQKTIYNFPCEDLRTIDQLWVKYSNARFGFSVQKQIYLNCGAKLDGNDPPDVHKKFGQEVGWLSGAWSWKNYDSMNFDISALQGHLPVKVIWVDNFDIFRGLYSPFPCFTHYIILSRTDL